MSQNLPKRSLQDFQSLRHPNHFVLAGANNRIVMITYRFVAAPVQANRDFFYIDCMTVYFNCKYFPWYTRELLECLLGISPSGRNPCGGNHQLRANVNVSPFLTSTVFSIFIVVVNVFISMPIFPLYTELCNVYPRVTASQRFLRGLPVVLEWPVRLRHEIWRSYKEGSWVL